MTTATAVATTPPEVSRTAPAASPDGPVPRRIRHAAVCAVLVALAFNSSAGRLAGDTKIDLTVDPWGFLRRAMHLWEPLGFSGQVQNQAYGYLFPMGPFFGLGHAAGLPGWVVERLWWSALLVTAYTGVVTLAGRLHVGTALAQGLGGIAYATSPHLLTVLGSRSAEALPMCLAPWAVVPLLAAGGSPRRRAMRSGLAVLFMGGINATLTVAALLPALLFLLVGDRVPRRRALTGWWVVAVGLATFWWLVPLLLLGRYSTPFLDYIESAGFTTRVTSLVESLRGTSDWAAYLPQSGWRAGLQLLTVPALVLMSAAVVAFGLGGLALRSMPQRRWLVTTLLLGVAVVTAGHAAGVQGLFATPLRSLLDGALAPLRNVHKFDVVLRLPLTLGLVHVVGRCRLPRLTRSAAPATSPGGYARLLAVVVTLFVACCAVVATAAPLLARRIAPQHTYAEVPGYWRQAASWLDRHDARGRALIVPASHDQQYLWGTTSDNPLQPLAGTPWTERSGVPLVPTAGIRMLDAIGARLESGTPSPGLAATLQALGIDYVVARADLDPDVADNARPVLVQQALLGSPGLTPAAAFGPPVSSDQAFVELDQNLRRPVPAVRIWQVGTPGDHRVRVVPAAGVTRLAGGPESVLDLADAGVPATDSILSADASALPLTPGSTVITDGLRRRAVNVGTVTGNRSATLAPGEPTRLDRPVSDYQVHGGGADTVARMLGVRSVGASSSAADATAAPEADPSRQPWAAFDGDPATAWRPAPGFDPVGQWVDVRFAGARMVSTVTLTAAADGPAVQVRVTAGGRSASASLTPGRSRALTLPTVRADGLRVTIVRVLGAPAPGAAAGIAEVAVPGVHAARTLVVADTVPAGTPVGTIAFTAAAGGRAGCVQAVTRPLCAVGLYRQGEDDAGLDRTFTVPAAASYGLQVHVAPRPGPSLDALLAAASGSRITATASSQAVPDPRAAASAAVDGDRGTGWVASAADPDPRLTLRWTGARTVSRLRLVLDPLLAATAPSSIRITSPAGDRVATVAADGTATFTPLRTDRLTIALQAGLGLRTSFGPQPGTSVRLGLGVSEVTIPGVPVTPRATQDARPVHLACGQLPDVTIAGRAVQLEANTTVGAVRTGSPVAARPCSPGTVDLAAGAQRLVARSTPAWRVQDIVVRAAVPAAAPVADLAATAGHWGTTYRSVRVAARPTPALLVVTENANPGWHATLDGHALRAVTVDGSMQGYVVPAGAAGTVHLEYRPDHVYRAALIAGLVAVLVLLLLAARRSRGRARERPPSRRSRHGEPLVAVTGGVLLTVTGGVVGALVTVLAAGLVLAARHSSRCRGRRLDLACAGLAGAVYAGAGAALAVEPWGGADYAAGRDWMQVLCLIALALVAVSGLGRGRAAPDDAAA